MDENKMKKETLPSFSIAIPCYNVEKFVEDAIKSVLRFQYNGEIQIIIVDDASTDSTWQRIQKTLKHEALGKNICLVRHEINKGVAAATDTAYQYATCEWLVKADADDIQMPGRLNAYAELIRKYPRACALVLACQRISEDGKPYEFIPFSSFGKEVSEYYLYTPQQRYEGRLGIGHEPSFGDFGGTVAFKRELYLKWGNLVDDGCASTRFADDTVWGARYMLSGPVVGSNVVSCLYRTRSSGNLEYRCKGNSYKDLILQEVESVKSISYQAEANKRAKLCCLRAMHDSSLSDWQKDHILQCAHRYEQRQLYFSVRAEWWNWSWFKRVVWYILNRKKLLLVHQGWCFKRLIPLPFAAFARSIVLKLRQMS